MDLFRKQLKKKILKYFGVNVLVSLIVLFCTYPFVPKSAGTEAYGFTMLFFVFNSFALLIYWLMCLTGVIVIPNSLMKTKVYFVFSYLFLAFIGLIIFVYIFGFYFFNELNYLLCFISFFLGQIISLFLVLKFIENNKITHN